MEIFTRLVREQGITVILVTHEEDVADYADRIVRMRDGRIVEDCSKRPRTRAARKPAACRAAIGPQPCRPRVRHPGEAASA